MHDDRCFAEAVQCEFRRLFLPDRDKPSPDEELAMPGLLSNAADRVFREDLFRQFPPRTVGKQELITCRSISMFNSIAAKFHQASEYGVDHAGSATQAGGAALAAQCEMGWFAAPAQARSMQARCGGRWPDVASARGRRAAG